MTIHNKVLIKNLSIGSKFSRSNRLSCKNKQKKNLNCKLPSILFYKIGTRYHPIFFDLITIFHTFKSGEWFNVSTCTCDIMLSAFSEVSLLSLILEQLIMWKEIHFHPVLSCLLVWWYSWKKGWQGRSFVECHQAVSFEQFALSLSPSLHLSM